VPENGVKPVGFPAQYCAYHGFYGNKASPIPEGIVYSLIPYLPGLEFKGGSGVRVQCGTWSVNGGGVNGWLDGTGLSLSHEIAEAATDPVQIPNARGKVIGLGWILPSTLKIEPDSQNEISDVCQDVGLKNIFTVGKFMMAAQSLYSNKAPTVGAPANTTGYCVTQ